MKRLLITGSNGLLGQKIVNQLLSNETVQVLACSRGDNRNPNIPTNHIHYHELDLTNKQLVDAAFKSFQPDSVIHTAAMTNVDACELSPDECKRQNIEATSNIVGACRKVGAHLVHLSTDFIFDGKSGPYREDDIPNPLSIYGHAKLAAESIVLNSGVSAAIIRTVLVYGALPDLSRSNIVIWALNALKSGKPINAVDDQVRTPTLAEDLAAGCLLAAEQGATGIYHISGFEPMNIYELVLKVAAFWKLPSDQVKASKSEDIGQPAKRPPITGFIVDKAITELGYKPHSFNEGLAILKTQGLV